MDSIVLTSKDIADVKMKFGNNCSLVFAAENRLTYSITSGNVGNAFEVAPDVGEIKVRGHLDYENGPRVCAR